MQQACSEAYMYNSYVKNVKLSALLLVALTGVSIIINNECRIKCFLRTIRCFNKTESWLLSLYLAPVFKQDNRKWLV